jgi:hypothetical protein
MILDGGPQRRHRRCQPGVSSAGTITVTGAATGKVIASYEVANGQLAKIQLAPGTYTITGTFADAFRNNEHILARPRTVAIAADTTVRQDVAASIK